MPDLILMDIQLPGMDGLEATALLKGDDATRAIPVIALTALAMKGDEERIRAAGCDGYIAKPMHYKDVSRRRLGAAGPGMSGPAGRARTPAHILIVDDERANRTLLEIMLEPEGYVLSTATNGEDALALIARDAPDLVLLDVMMPGINGYVVAARIKEVKRTPPVRVLMLSSLDDSNSRTHGLGAGADGFLTKPVDRTELCAKVAEILRASTPAPHSPE